MVVCACVCVTRAEEGEGLHRGDFAFLELVCFDLFS